MPSTDQTSPSDANSVDVRVAILPGRNSINLAMQDKNGRGIEEIDFPRSKSFIRFKFPDDYFQNVDIRVFEANEAATKSDIMTAYNTSRSNGITKFDNTFGGNASSGEGSREFVKRGFQNRTLIIADRSTDAAQDTDHSFIIKFTYDGNTALYDPKIRNTGRD